MAQSRKPCQWDRSVLNYFVSWKDWKRRHDACMFVKHHSLTTSSQLETHLQGAPKIFLSTCPSDKHYIKFGCPKPKGSCPKSFAQNSKTIRHIFYCLLSHNQPFCRKAKLHRSFLSGHFCQSVFFDPVTPNELSEIFNAFRPGKAAGHDRIPISIIKQSIQIIADPLLI